MFGIALSLAILPGDASAFGHRRGCCGGCGGCGCGYSYNTGCGCNSCCSNFYFNGCSTCGVSSCGCNTVFLDQGATYSTGFWPTTSCCGSSTIIENSTTSVNQSGMKTVAPAPPLPNTNMAPNLNAAPPNPPAPANK